VDGVAFLASFLEEHQASQEIRAEDLRREWTELSYTLGREVTVLDGEREITGLAQGIDDQGALLIETDQGRRRVVCGDLTVRD
jgi:biotin-(acetyl-CoA carboxylase) ligase